MATAKEIEEIIGISARTIETWSRTRDEKYLLAKLLKSYSKFELSQRIDHILKEDEFEKKSMGEITVCIARNLFDTGIIDSNENFYIRGASKLDTARLNSLPNYQPFLDYFDKPISHDLTIEMMETSLTKEGKPLKRIFIVDFASLLPSKNNLKAMYNRSTDEIIKIFSKYDIDDEKYIYSVKLILITKSKKPKFLLEDAELAEKIKILDFDEIARNLYGGKVVAT